MSFDVFFQSCGYAGPPVKQVNPFTGETVSVRPSKPLSATELKAVRQVLRRAGARGAADDGSFVVDFADGGGAEISADDLATGCMASLRSLTPEVTQFLFDLLNAGNWVMLPAMEDNVTVATSPDRVADLPPDQPPGVVCLSAEELGVLLSRGVAAWKKYRKQIGREGG